MSEKRVLENKVDPTDFKDILLNKGCTLLEDETVTKNWYGRTIMSDSLFVFRKGRIQIGINAKGNVAYDSMATDIIDEALISYYTSRLERQGFRYTKEKIGSKTVLTISR